MELCSIHPHILYTFFINNLSKRKLQKMLTKL